jgi:hypothetical protein
MAIVTGLVIVAVLASMVLTLALCRASGNRERMAEECTRIDALRELLSRHQ